MKHRLSFNIVLQYLQEQQRLIVAELRQGKDGDALEKKRQFDQAINCLKFCERHQIHPDAEVTTLPWPREAFGEFLVVDVDEMGAKSSWSPVMIGNEEVTLQGGDIVLRHRHPFNLPPDEVKGE